MDYRNEASPLLRDFLAYHEVIKGHSQKTVDEYFLDLRTFFRFLKVQRGTVPDNVPFDEISIRDVDLPFVASITKEEVYDFLTYLSRDRVKQYRSTLPAYGLSASSRARKLATIRSFFKYLTLKTGQLENNPVEAMDMPKSRGALPKYLTVEESRRLLDAVDGLNKERDYCMLMIFLNCGLRISELVGLNLSDLRADHLRVLGKGNKERVVYLNDATAEAINSYLAVRKVYGAESPALFLSRQKQRITRSAVHSRVKHCLLAAGLDPDAYSSHKLRHTAATLMLGSGVDLKTLQLLLGHEHLSTTEIYTHIESTDLKIAANANPLAHYHPEEQTKE